jgi:hypothetical protein
MRAASRHAKPKKHAKLKKKAVRPRISMLAAVAVACLAVTFISLHGGSAPAKSTAASASTPSATIEIKAAGPVPSVTGDKVSLDAYQVDFRAVIRKRIAVARKHRAEIAAERRTRQQAAAQATQAPAKSSATLSVGSDPAASALGACIRGVEEGGSYAWGRGNGGGAYQFLLATWENYGGAASEYGSASAAYQNQIFNNAVAEGGASNWTDYDGC